MNNLFANEIFGVLEPKHGKKFDLVGTPLSANQDFYFVSKWKEIFSRYSVARIFIYKTQEEDWSYWFNPVDDQIVQKGIELTFKSELYETALIYYNILVDLSWAITYVTAEYAIYKFDNKGNAIDALDLSEMVTIEEAYEMLRKTENGISTPNAKGNPFEYLSIMRPEFKEAIDLIIDFWAKFSNSNIRNLYNYLKHKGKPIYKEIEELRGGRLMNIKIFGKEIPSEIRDVQKLICLENGIKELVDFDDNVLFHYIKQLLDLLEVAVNPSPMAFL